MKNLFVILALCVVSLYALDGFDFYRKKMDECLSENGLSEYDLKYVFKIGKPDYESPKNISDKTLACMLSCMYHLYKNRQTIDKAIATVINRDDSLTAEKKKNLLGTVRNCTREAGDDDCVLLHCLDVTKEPFSKIITAGKKIKPSKIDTD
uniref:Putative odorant binding protein 52 n=1 Tax=Nasonia vitripennis TaxID=7425 RepID=G8B1Q7_NASVI|nr:putative odorant binding protein 52 [Nasonia vitripennis]